MIPPFPLRFLHNGEYISFSEDILDLLDRFTLPTSVVAACDGVRMYYRDIKAAHVGADESLVNQERRVLDARRDGLYSGLVHLAQAYVSNPVAEKCAAGRLLADRFSDYGTATEVIEQGDANESADINGVLRDLRMPEFAAAATLIGGDDWIVELTRVQARFEEKSAERNAEQTGRLQAQPLNIETLREKADLQFRNLFRKINSFHETEEGAAPWPELIAAISTVIANARLIVAARKGRAAAAPDAPAA
ncbi:MAG: hypothetical protein EOO11_13740 [Chitinophagaceae bacterium]|nr:MAG: hypothetical protein EOO11_13740 [Chitinophagaceae bacterium]